jgi:glycosyltransferase involved in cell wall biosynthesis
MTRLRIGIDAHVIGRRQTGNERFLANLVRSMREQCDHDLFLYFTERDAARAWGARRFPQTIVRHMRPANPFLRIPLSLPTLAFVDRLDVLLVHYNSPPLVTCPVVTIVHDVAFARFPLFYSPFERTWMPRAIPASMRKAAAVVTVSEFSRDEIVTLYGIPREKVVVAYDGVDPIFSEGSPVSSPVEPPFFLAIGNLQPRKNVATLVRAFRELTRAHPDLPERLVIVGKAAFGSRDLYAEAEDLRRSGRVIFTGYAPEPELVGLLQQATAFAYPSVYEGFGLPVLEAMATGTPTLASDIPIMHEVAGDAALLIPPTDVAAWTDALDRVRDPDLREDLRRRGKARAARFSWERSGATVLETLERAAASPSQPRRKS